MAKMAKVEARAVPVLDRHPGAGARCASVRYSAALVTYAFLLGCGRAHPEYTVVDQVSPRQGEPPKSLADIEYFHPLQHALEVAEELDGLVPWVDVTDAPNGDRFAMADEIHVGADDDVVRFSGLRRVPVTKSASPVDPAVTYYPTGENKVGGPLRAEVDALLAHDPDDDTPVDASIRLHRPADTLTSVLEKEVALGKISTAEDYEAARVFALAARPQVNESKAAPVITAVIDAGGTILHAGQNGPCLVARIPSKALSTVAARSDVLRVDAPGTDVELETYANSVRWGSQIDSYVDIGELSAPYNGGMSNYDSQVDNIRVAVFDGPIATAHPSFGDGPLYHDPGDPTTRILSYHECPAVGACAPTVISCVWSYNHGTAVSSILLGDLREDQIPSYTATERDRRTGYAAEALAYLYTSDGLTTTTWPKVFDHTGGRSPKPVVLNVSLGQGNPNTLLTQNDPGYPSDWDHCNGIDGISQSANDLFESGVLLVTSAGNEAAVDPAECTVTIPGSAAGVFTVGNHSTNQLGGVDMVRKSNISINSSRGPAPSSPTSQLTLMAAFIVSAPLASGDEFPTFTLSKKVRGETDTMTFDGQAEESGDVCAGDGCPFGFHDVRVPPPIGIRFVGSVAPPPPNASCSTSYAHTALFAKFRCAANSSAMNRLKMIAPPPGTCSSRLP